MNIKLKYFGYLLGIVIAILLINIIFSQVIAFETPTFLKVLGNTDTWILFNGSIIGAFVGGLIAGLIAFNIAKIQMVETNKAKSESRKIEFRDDFQRKVSLRILELNLDLQEEFLFKDTLLKSILNEINSYNKLLASGRESIDLFIKQIQESLSVNVLSLERKLNSAMNTQLAYRRIILAYEIPLKEYKEKIREVMKLLTDNNNHHINLKHHLVALREYFPKRYIVPKELINKLDDIYNTNRKDFNNLDFTIHILNIDIQNSFSDLFNYKIKYPEYEEVY